MGGLSGTVLFFAIITAFSAVMVRVAVGRTEACIWFALSVSFAGTAITFALTVMSAEAMLLTAVLWLYAGLSSGYALRCFGKRYMARRARTIEIPISSPAYDPRGT